MTYYNKFKDSTYDNVSYYKAIDWNTLEDVVDKLTWEKLTEQFWLDTRIPVSNDLDDWRSLSKTEKDIVGKAFVGLTLLDTLQGEQGANLLAKNARTQHETAVWRNIEFMECYTKGHNLLTKNGFKDISEIKKGDYVLAYNKDSNTTAFEEVLETSEHKAEKIYHFYNKSKLDLKVSPGHNMLIEEKIHKVSSCNEWEQKVYTAEELYNKKFTNNYRLILNADYDVDNNNTLTPKERFFIAYQADGSHKQREIDKYNRLKNDTEYYKQCRSTDLYAIIQFAKERKIERWLDIVNDLSLPVTELQKTKNNKRTWSFHIKNDDFSINKEFKDWFDLSSFDKTKAKSFIKELSYWDGYTKDREKDDLYITYYTANESNYEFVKEVATLAGYTFYCSHVNKKGTDFYTYSIRIKRKLLTLALGYVNKEILNEDNVYGVEVPSHYLVVNTQNGNVISGNCVHAKSYSTIFSTLNTKSEIQELFNWGNNNEHLQLKARIINGVYQQGEHWKKQIASVFLESFLFYSGFYTPLWYLGNNKLPNVAEIIKLIIRDECVTGDHDVLTPNGWIPISQVTKDTLIAQYNLDTNSIDFAYPTNISSHFEQNPMEFRTQQGHINFACSPNHRILTFDKNGNSKVTFAKDFKTSPTKRIKNVAVIQNTDVKYQELTVEDRLLIAINADGSYDKTRNRDGEYRRSGEKTGTVPVKFSFTKERKIERLRELAKEADWKLTDVGKLDYCGRLYMTLYVPVQYANVEKPLPSKPLNEVSLQWCKEYIDEIAKWDGHIVKENPDRITWGTVRPDDAKLVQTIASLAGYRVHYSVKEDNRSETFSDYHRLQIHTKLDWTTTGGVVKTELEPQMVYGVEVPSSFLLTKRGDSISITGNSVHGTLGYKF